LNFTLVLELAAKPLPVTVRDVPTGPEVGLRVTAGVTVNVADAELDDASVAVIVCEPAVEEGIKKAFAVKLPPPLVVTVVSTVLPYLTVTREFDAKP
jgi:hypothetical protein